MRGYDAGDAVLACTPATNQPDLADLFCRGVSIGDLSKEPDFLVRHWQRVGCLQHGSPTIPRLTLKPRLKERGVLEAIDDTERPRHARITLKPCQRAPRRAGRGVRRATDPP